MTRPLRGVRVLDLTRLLPGAYATLLLADLGAEVLKIEDPAQGDYLRTLGPRTGGVGAAYRAVNRGKRSVALDLKAPQGRALFLRLVEHSDAVVEGFRPGVAARLGISYQDLAPRRPALVYCSLTGYGQDGPDRSRAGHDVAYLARSGILGATRGADGAPVIPAVPVADLAGGMLAALAVAAGLVDARTCGRGAYVDASMLEVLVSWAAPVLLAPLGASGDVSPDWLRGGLVCYHVYRTQDGRHVALGALEERFFEAFCRAVGRPDLIPARLTRADPANPAYRALADLFASRDLAAWVRLAREVDTVLEPVRDPAEVREDPHLVARRLVGPDPEVGAIGAVRLPLVWDGERPEAGPPAPRHGEHTREVLESLGLEEEEIAALARAGVVRLDLPPQDPPRGPRNNDSAPS